MLGRAHPAGGLRAFRRTVSFPGSRRVEQGGVALHVAPSGDGAILFSSLSAGTADAAICDQLEQSRDPRAALEWIVYSHDAPPACRSASRPMVSPLTGSETILVLRLDHMRVPLAATGIDIRHIVSPDEVAGIAVLQQQIWGGDAGEIAERLAGRLVETPDAIGLFAAFVDGMLASAAQITYYPARALPAWCARPPCIASFRIDFVPLGLTSFLPASDN